MGIEAYGLVGFYMSLSGVLGILDLGIGATLNRELARLSVIDESVTEQRNLVRTLEAIYWGIAILAGATVVILAPYISHHWIKAQSLDSQSVAQAVRLMGISVALQFPVSFYQGGLMGLQRQVLVNAILIVVGTLRSAGAVAVLWLVTPTIETFLGWQIVAGIIGSGLFLTATWRCLPARGQAARFNIKIFRGVWKYAVAVSANAIIGIILTQLDKVILSRMLSLEMFGYYSLAATVGSTIWMIILPFNSAIFPRFVQLHELSQPEELRQFFHRTSQLLSLILFPVCALIVVFSGEILSIWLHNPIVVEHCHLIVSLLVFGTMLNGMASIPGYSASAFGWPQLVTYTNAAQVIIIAPLIIGLAYKYQGIGAAVAWIALNSTYIVFMVPVYFQRHFVKDRGAWYWRDIAVPAVTAFTICICGFVLGPSASSSQLVTGSWLMLIGAVALIATGSTLPHVRTLISSWYQNLIR